MKVRFVSGPKINTIEHLQPSIANVLIASGLAEHVPYKDFRERLATEGQGMQTPDPNYVHGVQWQVKEHSLVNAAQGSAFIERRSGTEVLYGTPDNFKDCPKSILVRFYELNKVEDPEAIAERRIQDKYRLEDEQKKQREREIGGAARLGLYQRT